MLFQGKDFKPQGNRCRPCLTRKSVSKRSLTRRYFERLRVPGLELMSTGWETVLISLVLLCSGALLCCIGRGSWWIGKQIQIYLILNITEFHKCLYVKSKAWDPVMSLTYLSFSFPWMCHAGTPLTTEGQRWESSIRTSSFSGGKKKSLSAATVPPLSYFPHHFPDYFPLILISNSHLTALVFKCNHLG